MLEVLFRLFVAGSLMMGSAHCPLLVAQPALPRIAMPAVEGRTQLSSSPLHAADARRA